MQQQIKEYDFFISHASEDKETFVRPLAQELINIGFKVWYDEFTLKFGDSLFEEISNGIRKSDFGLVIISPNFLKKEWTKKELNGLFSKEIFLKENIILPVWLNISYEDIYNLSPILSDKVAVKVENNEIIKVVEKVLSLTKSRVVTIDEVKKKVDFLTNCDLFERKKYFIDSENRINNLVHFQEAYYEWFCSDEAFGDDDWNDFLADKKKHELQSKYNLPHNITYNSEFEPGRSMNIIIGLVKKWVYKKSTVKEIFEMIFLIDHYHELDLPYILWGFANDSLIDSDTYDLCFNAPYYVNENKRVNKEIILKQGTKIWSEYYGKNKIK